jgi:pimeloyl-ACP methyl ester carboxylesterase
MDRTASWASTPIFWRASASRCSRTTSAAPGSVSPAEYWEKYKNPTLIVFGQFETYSKPSSDIARFKEAMKKAGNSRYTIAIIPKAEHTMREAKTGGPRERPYLNRFVAGYFGTLREWLRQNVPAN